MKSVCGGIRLYIMLFMYIFFLVGCSGKNQEQYNSDKDNEKIISINEVDVNIDEIMPYLLQVKMEFEELGGEDVWDHNDFSGGKKAEDVAKLGVLDNIIRTKILVNKAEEMGVIITQEEIEEVESQALNYYNNLNEEDIKSYNLTKQSMVNSFKDYRLANKLTSSMTKEYIPDDEELENKLMEDEQYATVKTSDLKELLVNIKVQHILIKTHEKNNQDEYILISSDIEEKAKEQIEEIFDKVIKGEDFTKLVKEYSQEDNMEEQKGEHIIPIRILSDQFDVLKDLENGSISSIIQSDYGFHVFKVLERYIPTEKEIEDFQIKFNDYEKELREKYKVELQNTAFDNIYNEWKDNAVVDLNEELWTKIDIFGKINENISTDENIE